MKNRNKRFTSVLAASMALGMMAPAMVSVAPVMAATENTTIVSTTRVDTSTTDTGLVYGIYTIKGNYTGQYVAVLLDGTGYKGDGDLVINANMSLKGDTYDKNYPVTVVGINDLAFNSGTDTNVYTGAGVKALETLTINGSSSDPMVIGTQAFANCANLSSVTLNNVKSIGDYAFRINSPESSNLVSVTTDDSLKTIGNGAFFNQSGLTSITLSTALTKIGNAAFGNTGLSGVIDLPGTLENIGTGAFAVNDEISKGLQLNWPVSNGTDADITAAGCIFEWTGSVTINDLDPEFFYIAGVEDTLPTNVAGSNQKYWKASPSIKLNFLSDTIHDTFRNVVNTNIKVPLGTTVTITGQLGSGVEKAAQFMAGKLYIDGQLVKNVTNKDDDSYKFVTPQVGTYTVKYVSVKGLSRTVTIEVVNYNNNMWMDANFTIPNPWTLGTTEDPTGAEAKFGTPYYVYSTSKNGTYNTEKPNFTGTWYVKAVVDGTNEYNGLETAPVKFTVLPAADINTGWVESGDNWMYKEDGEFVTDALKEIDGDTYLFDSEGVMQTGWKKNDTTNGNWMFFDNAGHAKKGWLNDNGTWYYLDSNAVMVANEWVKDAGKDYFLTNNGAMAVSRWLTKDGHDVYVDNSGALKTGWLAWNMNWYYLEPSTGYMATSGTVDGWNIQSNGIAVKA